MSNPAITIEYSIKPPAGIHPGALLTSKTVLCHVDTTPDKGQRQFYAALHSAIQEARNAMGDDLTAWRDLVGKAELTKEPKPLKDEKDEAEEEEEEEDGEQ